MSARPIRPDELLDLARSLVPANAPAGRPRTAHLRRGVSLAYYALFHQLVDLATAELCGTTPVQAPTRWRASRWFAHSDVQILAEAITGTGSAAGKALVPVLGTAHPHVLKMAEAFKELQDARYQADYDHQYDIARPEALELVDLAANAVATARRLHHDGEPSFQLFLKLMVGAVKIARTRTP